MKETHLSVTQRSCLLKTEANGVETVVNRTPPRVNFRITFGSVSTMSKMCFRLKIVIGIIKLRFCARNSDIIEAAPL